MLGSSVVIAADSEHSTIAVLIGRSGDRLCGQIARRLAIHRSADADARGAPAADRSAFSTSASAATAENDVPSLRASSSSVASATAGTVIVIWR